VPEQVFAQPSEKIALFLRHLWATDGCIYLDGRGRYIVLRYDSSSERLSADVQSLLLRLGINARRECVEMPDKGRPIHRLDIRGGADATRFLVTVGAVGARKRRQRLEVLSWLDGRRRRPKRDTIPAAAWSLARHAKGRSGVVTSPVALGGRSAITRERALSVAAAVDSDELALLAMSDVYWDEIVAIEPVGGDEVYDLTVQGLHNFVADDLIAHNSIEQDSDLVFFIYRDEYYNDDSDQQGLAEVILAKHRNGPTDMVKLSFLKRYAKFADLAA
jgi:replicative DNA helicase